MYYRVPACHEQLGMILDETSRAHLGRFCHSWYQSHSEDNTIITGLFAKTKRAGEATLYSPITIRMLETRWQS